MGRIRIAHEVGTNPLASSAAPPNVAAMQRQDTVWQRSKLAETFVHEVRGGVPYAADQLEMMMRVIAARDTPVRRFLDLGCGSGVLASAVLAHYPQAQAVLIDFSEPMLAQARASFSEAESTPQIILADLATPAWRDAVAAEPFDLIVSGYAIHHLSDTRKRELYREIYQQLTPGGLFINVEHVASRTPALEALSDQLMIDTIFAFQRGKGSDKTRAQIASEFVHRPDKAANILAPVEQQCAWLREIGFEEVDCFFKVFELAVFGGSRPRV